MVSISEEICFWNITHVLNNPIESSSIRSSQRFNRSRLDKRTSITNGNNSNSNGCNGNNHLQPNTFANILTNCDINNGNYQQNGTNPWIGKTGATDKPELLSCIKFVGSSTEKLFVNSSFDEFLTIDNEGEIYYLRINNLNSRI